MAKREISMIPGASHEDLAGGFERSDLRLYAIEQIFPRCHKRISALALKIGRELFDVDAGSGKGGELPLSIAAIFRQDFA